MPLSLVNVMVPIDTMESRGFKGAVKLDKAYAARLNSRAAGLENS